MAKEAVDDSAVQSVIKQLFDALRVDIKGAKAGFYTADKGEDPYAGDNPPTVAEVALWNEFGTERIPARPFLRTAQQTAVSKCARLVQVHMDEGANNLEQIFKECALLLKDEIQQQITHGKFAPNAPATIRRKKSSHPLVDTGNLRQSVHCAVVRRDSDEVIE